MDGQMNQNQTADPAAGQGTGEKTFTQEDVNRIVQDRLAKEKARNSGETDFAKREQDLARRELRMTAKELLSEKGLSVQLLDALNYTDKEAMEKSIAVIDKAFNDYKANLPRPTFRGFVPGASSDRLPKISEDQQIRDAMGIRVWQKGIKKDGN